MVTVADASPVKIANVAREQCDQQPPTQTENVKEARGLVAEFSNDLVSQTPREWLIEYLELKSASFLGVDVMQHAGAYEAKVSYSKPADWKTVVGHDGGDCRVLESEFRERVGSSVDVFGEYVVKQQPPRHRKTKRHQTLSMRQSW